MQVFNNSTLQDFTLNNVALAEPTKISRESFSREIDYLGKELCLAMIARGLRIIDHAGLALLIFSVPRTVKDFFDCLDARLQTNKSSVTEGRICVSTTNTQLLTKIKETVGRSWFLKVQIHSVYTAKGGTTIINLLQGIQSMD